LEFIKANAAEKGVSNVQVVQVSEQGLVLPEKVDLVFMRNVCHHIPDRVTYFNRLEAWLKLDGRVAIIEHKGGGRFSFHRLFERRVSKETIIKEMTNAGYRLVDDEGFLSEQSFTIFQKASRNSDATAP
jgi:arsenite methyltransferase